MRRSKSPSDLPLNATLTPTSEIKPAGSILKRLALLGGYLQDWMVSRHEPTIEEKCDRNGHCYWRVYDPITQNYSIFDSENKVRVWLDQRYYQ